MSAPLDNEPSTVPVPSPRRRGTSAVVVLGTALVVLAILKPWTFGAPTGTPVASPGTVGPSDEVTPAAVEPSVVTVLPTPSIWDPNAIACMSSEGDRVLALLRAPGLEVRTWLTLDDPTLADPLDPSVVPLRLPSSHVIGLGVCARRLVQDASIGSAAEILDVELVTSTGRPALVDLGVAGVITKQLGIASMGVLYGPPAGIVASSPPGRPRGSISPGSSPVDGAWPTWPVGDYAVAFRFPGDPPTARRWIRLDILAAAGQYG